MGAMKTLVLLLVGPLAALPPAPLRAMEGTVRTFAVCAGRLSAVMEDQWMFDGPGSEQTELQLHAMVALVEATMEPGTGPQVLDWRINAKVAQRALLAQARLSTDMRLAQTAAARAEALAAECRSMLLGSPGS